ncbi:MAG: PAS domain S-box protein [Desulfobacterales bacterium]|jgi:PAS domain S-box-containing protein
MADRPTYEQLAKRVEDLERKLQGCRTGRTETAVQEDDGMRKTGEPLWPGNDLRYREIVDSIGEAIWLFDWSRQGFVYVNPAYEAIWGRSAEALHGHYEGWSKSIHPDDLAFAKESFIRIAETGGGEKREYRIVRPDGSVRWVSDRGYVIRDRQGQIVRIAGIAKDITDRKQAEDTLRKYEKIVATSKDMMALVDGDGIFQAVSDSYLEAHGKTRTEIIGGSLLDLVGRERFESDIKPRFDRCLAGEEVTFRLWFDFAGMGNRFMEAVYSPFRDKNGHIVGVVVVSRDITETKNLQEQLLQSQKMEAIGTLAGGIAHDFNNLLMGIQGRTSIMLVDIDADHPHAENLKGIEEHVRSASNLTRQLLGFARGGKYNVKPLDLGAVIREKNRMFGRMQKGIVIQEKLQPDLWPVEADRSQIEQVLLNIYINAWQAMPGSGTLYIQGANVHLDSPAVAAYRLSPGRYVKISVTDTGIGMDAATRSRIFEPFFTTKPMGRGTGLGLASAYGIVKNHAGFITVESIEGKGTTVDINLPATDKRVAADDRTTEPLHKGAGTVLLVDDEEMVVAVGAQMLRRLGYDVLTADGGRAALKICKRHHARISLVILDLIMPDLGGADTCTLLKAVHPAIKVLLSSGYGINGNSSDIVKSGCDGFIQKPFDLNALSQKINDIVSSARA